MSFQSVIVPAISSCSGGFVNQLRVGVSPLIIVRSNRLSIIRMPEFVRLVLRLVRIDLITFLQRCLRLNHRYSTYHIVQVSFPCSLFYVIVVWLVCFHTGGWVDRSKRLHKKVRMWVDFQTPGRLGLTSDYVNFLETTVYQK